MTHSLHREGRIESLKKDFCLFIYPARGFNYPGSAPKVRRLMDLVYQEEPVNILVTTLRQNLYSGVTPEDVLESVKKDGARMYCAFNDKEKLKKLLIRMKEADEGMSIMVSGLIDQVREIAAAAGLRPHTINLSLGIHGRTELLPPADVRQFTTMCGHAMIAPGLVRDVLRKVKTGKLSPWEASLVLAKPCACGIYNPMRSVELLGETAPLYAVSRW